MSRLKHASQTGRRVGLGLWLTLGASSVWALDVSIHASFRPDSANPQQNKFNNDTPPSGYCEYYPAQCSDNQMFSLRVPIQFHSDTPIEAHHASPREGATFKVPAQGRELSVIHEATGETETVRVRIAGLGSTYVTEDVIKLVGGSGSDYRLAHNQLWGASWVNAPAPCLYSGVGYYGGAHYGFFWKTPTEGTCSKQAQFDVPWLRYDYLDFAYELVTPNPLGMSAGRYSGSLTYSVGPHGDFDMGDVMQPSDSVLTLNFTLEVQHTLKVEIPPGGNRVELVPQGGWQAWLTQGRKPSRLFRDQTFNISASSRFKMNMDCQYSLDGNRCSVRDPVSGHVVPLDVSVTLPHGLVDGADQPVTRRPLRRDGSGTELIQPLFYVDRTPATLHFEIAPGETAEMLKPGITRSYSGHVTVIWDSEVG
ncbi:hypothetical protein PMI35_01638 [Pseudomonas sp. GM78]|uniref:hypothetical protein n=1 Tax=Pseudomonas sp. GM78 TaxID=1144337 RepID=UPI00027069E7|nr:hypothetical protein [Pseudomonas sp. GM78]EJN31120.1 hypothetical protein PMI35_01638 [Pseudomonas sp. GM78]